ncbi:MAG: TIGR02453 family protein, partial [Myxococcales bacterium]|nr:TIGR02453 family protein [Myxococcales bacterium]
MSATNDGPYFGDETLDFLEELSLNNNRDWFTAHKPRYESFVRDPALAFVRAMAPRLERLAPSLIADDRKMGGSLMRIYRDTRFSKDKTPYKTNIGIHFRHKSAKDVHAPGLYVHVGLDGHFVGV